MRTPRSRWLAPVGSGPAALLRKVTLEKGSCFLSLRIRWPWEDLWLPRQQGPQVSKHQENKKTRESNKIQLVHVSELGGTGCLGSWRRMTVCSRDTCLGLQSCQASVRLSATRHGGRQAFSTSRGSQGDRARRLPGCWARPVAAGPPPPRGTPAISFLTLKSRSALRSWFWSPDQTAGFNF